MRKINVKSFAKVNLSIDVAGVQEDGMHIVEMVMQEVNLHDKVSVEWIENGDEQKEIEVKTNKNFLPTDERNIAYKAAKLMIDEYGQNVKGGKVYIDIEKIVPVAAGLAGGSGNGAAVLHAINVLWDLKLRLGTLCALGEKLGSDVPFQVKALARGNKIIYEKLNKDEGAFTCAFATGTGVELQKVNCIKSYMVLVKPPFSVSTKKVYEGIDDCQITERPNTQELIQALEDENQELIIKNMINVLENYTIKEHPEIGEIKNLLIEKTKAAHALMSGSGPTVFGLYDTKENAKKACMAMRDLGYEAYWTRSLL